jgi:hypothetical protein
VTVLGPFTVRARLEFGGGSVQVDRHDEFERAVSEAIALANGRHWWWDHDETPLDRVWVEDAGGDHVFDVGAGVTQA